MRDQQDKPPPTQAKQQPAPKPAVEPTAPPTQKPSALIKKPQKAPAKKIPPTPKRLPRDTEIKFQTPIPAALIAFNTILTKRDNFPCTE